MEENQIPIHRPVLLVIDIQASTFKDENEDRSIPNMEGYRERMENARPLIDAAHECNIPVIFVQEIHRATGVDFGRELDGAETVHCLDDDPMTEIAFEEMGFQSGDHIVQKRRYSSFFGTDLEILLKGLKADTLFLVGGLTDVCVHYTFVDAHQHDYFTRVVEDCVAGSTLKAHQASLEAMEYLQTGAVLKSDQVLKKFRSFRAL